METKLVLQIAPRARLQIEQIAIYIIEKGYPDTAKAFALQMFDFADSLTNMPAKYTLCRKPVFRRWNYRCAVFHTNYVFVYKLTEKEVILRHVIHGKRLK